MKDKQANRRIRLLLAVFVLVFAGTHARAVWLQGVQASSLGKMAERQHHESIVIPAGRGTIYDAAGVQLAIGETSTTVYADPRPPTGPRPIAVAAQTFLSADQEPPLPDPLALETGSPPIHRSPRRHPNSPPNDTPEPTLPHSTNTGALPYRAVSAKISSALIPAVTIAVFLFASIVMPFICERSITIPISQVPQPILL